MTGHWYEPEPFTNLRGVVGGIGYVNAAGEWVEEWWALPDIGVPEKDTR